MTSTNPLWDPDTTLMFYIRSPALLTVCRLCRGIEVHPINFWGVLVSVTAVLLLNVLSTDDSLG